MPYGCSQEEIQSALLKFLVALIDTTEMNHVTKLFFVPVGLPGMGKSTLAKNMRNTILKNLTVKSQQASHDGSNLQLAASDRAIEESASDSNENETTASL